MKKIVLAVIGLLLLSTTNTIGQKKIKVLDTLTFKQSQDINFFQNVRNNAKVSVYETASGNVVKLGDTLVLGIPTSSELNTTSTTGGVGNTYRASRTYSRSTTKKTYEFIQMGRPAGFGAVMSALGGEAPIMASNSFKNTQVIVKEMKAYHRGSRKKPLYVIMVLGEINDRAFGANKYLSLMDTELAIESGEIRLLNMKMTKEEAIAKLKESKELFELEVITKEDYEKIRKDLIPIIKGENK